MRLLLCKANRRRFVLFCRGAVAVVAAAAAAAARFAAGVRRHRLVVKCHRLVALTKQCRSTRYKAAARKW